MNKIITSQAFGRALVTAGIVDAEELNTISRVVIVAQGRDAVRLYIERFGDDRLIDLAEMLPGMDAEHATDPAEAWTP